MSSGPSQVTSVTNTAPPDFLLGPLTTAVNASESAFTGQPAGNTPLQPGNDFRGNRGRGVEPGLPPSGGVGVNQSQDVLRQNQGLDELFNRGQGGSPLLDQAQQTTQQTLAGDFLSPDSNPFLEQTFNRAADLTRGRLDTEFSGAGRNLGASQPARSEELQTLASNIFGGNFQQERGRQIQAASQAAPLAGADFQNIQAMIDSGSFNLDQFINRLGGLIPGAGGVTRSTQPVFKTGLF